MEKEKEILLILSYYNDTKKQKDKSIRNGALYNYAEGKEDAYKWVLCNIYKLSYEDKRL